MMEGYGDSDDTLPLITKSPYISMQVSMFDGLPLFYMQVCCSQSISIRFEYLSVRSSVAVRVQCIIDLTDAAVIKAPLHHYGQCFPLPVFAKTAPSSGARCQVKICSLNTFIRHNNLVQHQLPSHQPHPLSLVQLSNEAWLSLVQLQRGLALIGPAPTRLGSHWSKAS